MTETTKYIVYWCDEQHSDLIASFSGDDYSKVVAFTKNLRDTEQANGANWGRYEICLAFREYQPAEGFSPDGWSDWDIVEVMDIFELPNLG